MDTTWYVPPSHRSAWEALPQKTLRVGARELSFPEPRLTEMEQLVHGLRAPAKSVEEIGRAIGGVARRFLEEKATRNQALDLLVSTGRARGMLEASMDHLFGEWASAGAGDRALGAFAGLDRHRLSAPRLTYHVLAGNVPWAGVDSLFAATLVRSASLLKLSSHEPILAGLVARALAEEDPELGDALAVLHWPGGSRALEEAVLQAADAVVAFGDNATVAEYAGRLAHRIAAGRTRFVPRGHRVSAAVVGPRGGEAVARALALDLVCEDQEGCLSPQAVYLVGMSEPERFAEHLAAALERYEAQWPRAATDAGRSASVQQERAAAEFAGARVLAPEGSTAWTVVVDRAATFTPVPAARFARLRVVDSLEQAVTALEPARGLLSTIGVAGFDDTPLALASLAPGRICPVGRMQRPPAGWNHEGASDAAALLQWIEWEVG